MGGSTRAAGRSRPCQAALPHGTAASPGTRVPPEPHRRRARMFTGIVEDLGEVQAVEQLGDFARIHVLSTVVTQDARLGDSICVNGVCLTVTALLGASQLGAGPLGGAPPARDAPAGVPDT